MLKDTVFKSHKLLAALKKVVGEVGEPHWITLESVSNDDFTDNDKDISKKDVRVSSFKDAQSKAEKFIKDNELGGGNWSGGQILDKDKNQIAHVSYNGRVWAGDDNDEEINI